MGAEVAAEALKWAVPALLGAIAALLGRGLRALKARQDAQEAEAAALRDGMRSLLRCELVRAHKSHVVRGEPMGLDDLEYVAKTYEAYHGLGGNGTGTRLYEDIKRIEIREG